MVLGFRGLGFKASLGSTWTLDLEFESDFEFECKEDVWDTNESAAWVDIRCAQLRKKGEIRRSLFSTPGGPVSLNPKP